MITTRLLAAAMLVTAVSLPALAGEGNGDPFPGPDAVVREDVSKPAYTMGASAPFNHFYTPQPTPMNGYSAASSASQDPFPFRASGQAIQTQTMPEQPSAVVAAPRRNTHG